MMAERQDDEIAFELHSASFDDRRDAVLWFGKLSYGWTIPLSFATDEAAADVCRQIIALLAPHWREHRELERVRMDAALVQMDIEARERASAAKAKRQRQRKAPKTPAKQTRCPLCSEPLNEDEVEARFECSHCGGLPDDNTEAGQCSTCAKFCAKVADRVCPHCEEEVGELEVVNGWEIGGEFVSDQELSTAAEGSPTKANREEA